MKKIVIVLIGLVASATIGHAQNVFVTNPTSKPVPVTVVAGGPGGAATNAAAANIATSQVTAGAAGTLAIARATRRQVTFKNTDATNTATIGPATVTTGNGIPLKPGESITVRSVALIQVIANAGSPVIAVMDEYD